MSAALATDDEGHSLARLNRIAADRDTGWVASTSLGGTRTNEQLVYLPTSVDAITAEYMADLNAFTLEDGAIFIANVNTVSNLETKIDDSRPNFRGMELGGRANGQSSRNFFLWYVPADTYNIERIAFNKGSNSLMFGDASPGGLAATYTKRARFTNLASVTGADYRHSCAPRSVAPLTGTGPPQKSRPPWSRIVRPESMHGEPA